MEGGATVGVLAPKPPMRSELLCFMYDKARILPFDDVVKLCVDFYKEDEIMAARNILESLEHKLYKRKGVDKLHNTVDDMLKLIVNPDVKLPTFYAVDLSRLPPVDITHCDMSAVLLELRNLRTELRSLKNLEDEVCALREQVKAQVAMSTAQSSEINDMRSQLNAVRANRIDEFPPLSGAGNPTTSRAGNPIPTVSAAGVVRAAAANGALANTRTRRPQKVCIGKYTRFGGTKSVHTVRNVELFVSRVHPSLNDNAIIGIAEESLNSSDIECCEDVTIKCERLPSKFDFYASFHLTVKVESSVFPSVIDLLMSAEVWPRGWYVRRFFYKKSCTAGKS